LKVNNHFCLRIFPGTTPEAWQSSGGLWHNTRWRWVCSCITDWQPSRV